jgi:L-glyceraldehyde 3-phosphate reductase
MDIYAVPRHYLPPPERYDTMQYRRSGKSGIKMSAISLGFWHNFGDIDSYANARQVARAAFSAGINCFDLANNYGPTYGSAEENFGRMMRDDFAPYRDELFIASKAGYDMWAGPFGVGGSRKYLLASLDQSLKRMNLDYVDVFYHHCMDTETPLEESMSALVQAVRAGKALYAGISNYSPEQAKKAFALLKAEGVPCLVEQSAYNMLNRAPEIGLFDALNEYGVGFAAYSPLAQGILSGKYNKSIPKDSRAGGYSKFLNETRLTDDVLSKIRALGDIADKRGQTMAQLALAWLLNNPFVTTVIIGASRTTQLLENIKTVKNITFSETELKRIKEVID